MWHEFDPATRKLTIIDAPSFAPAAVPADPPVPEGDERFGQRITAGDRSFATSYPTGRFWEFAGESAVLRGETQAPAEPMWWLKATEDCVAGISYYGFTFRFDLRTGEFRRSEVDNRAAGGNTVMFLETVSPRCVIGANYSQQNLFAVDPETGAIRESSTVVARVSGEPYCAVGFGGKGYVGIYVNSLISLYDPEQPFAYGQNPRELIELSTRYQQTRPRAAAASDRLVFISSDGDYNVLGGALVVIEPESGKIDVYHHVIKDQNLPTLAYDPVTKLLWGGTDRWGQMQSHPPTQENSFVYAFDPETRTVAERLVLWPGADVTAVLGVSASGVLVASSGAELALVHTPTREVLYKGPSPLGESPAAIPTKVRTGSDGFSYCLVNGILCRWDFDKNALTPVARTPGCSLLTEPSPGLWLLADNRSVYKVRMGN